MQAIPPLFVSHGPPSILLMSGKTPAFLRGLGACISRPRGIVCLSAHWETVAPMVTSAPFPATLHDIPGPPPLFEEYYPAPGSPSLAARVCALLAAAGFTPTPEPERGLDHGVWVPLKMMFPQADIPVVQLSIQTEEKARYHYRLGKALRPLAGEGVLIMGSGGAVHNLEEMCSDPTAPPLPYAAAFDLWLEEALAHGRIASVLDYGKRGPDPRQAHPYPAEHFVPLLVCVGTAGKEVRGRKLHHGFLYGTLSMAAFRWE
jgi:4,5-DOPA dioxygenase extradiol